ncbi:MAG: prepilin peptidase [Cyanobacteria bacterium SIG26]|nr:prepilin peptidase [Cyanobacteria bacterium SIG26]
MILSLVLLTFIFITGLCIGSFLNVVILRTVSEESIVFPASKCPKCQTPLKWFHNIPVFSYLFLKGKCAFCKEHISIQYPIIEIITALLFVGLFLKTCTPFDEFFGLSMINPIGIYQLIVYIFTLVITFFFIAIAGTDILEKKVADAHTLPLIWLGILYSVVYAISSFIGYSREYGMPQLNFDFFLSCPILYSMAAAILGFLIMESIARLGILLVGTRAFGEGDSYIAAGIGSVFGALLGCSGLYGNFLPIFQAVISILILSGIIQVILTLPIFIKKLINNKNWPTLNSLIIFAVYSVAYLFAQNSSLLNNQLLYWSGTILLLLIGLYTCRKLIYGIQENNAKGALYLPFGPAMIIASFIALFTMGF